MNTQQMKNLRAAAQILGSIVPFAAPWTGNHEPDMEILSKPLVKEWTTADGETFKGYAQVFCAGHGFHSVQTEDKIKGYFEQSKTNIDPDTVDWTKNYIYLNACEECILQSPVQTIVVEVRPIIFKK